MCLRPSDWEGFYEETLKYGIKDLDLSSPSAGRVKGCWRPRNNIFLSCFTLPIYI